MKTDSMTPEQIDRQIRDLSEQKRKLSEEQYNYEFGPSSVPPTRRSISTSKMIINVVFIVVGIAGIVGSFWPKFDMNKYTQFLQQYAIMWAPLIIAVGGGRAFKNFVSKKYEGPAASNNGPV